MEINYFLIAMGTLVGLLGGVLIGWTMQWPETKLKRRKKNDI